MSQVIYVLLNALLNCVEGISLYLFASCFFDIRLHGKQLAPAFLALIISNITIHVLIEAMLPLRLVSIALVDAVWILVTYRSHILTGLLISILFCSIMTAGDSFFIFLISATGLIQVSDAILQDPYSYYMVCYMAKIVELLGISILKAYSNHKSKLVISGWQDFLHIVMFPVMSSVIAFVLVKIYAIAEESAPWLLICAITLVLIDICSVILVSFLEDQQHKLHDMSILEHAIKVEHDNVSAWISAYSDQRKLTHDFQHQLTAIRGLAQQEVGSGNLMHYIDELMQIDLSTSLFVKTGRAVVDAIINQKYALAQSKGIKFSAQLDDLSEFPLSDESLVVVLANLIDNAIEACEKVTDSQRRTVLLKMHVTQNANFLYIENPTEFPVKIINNQVVLSNSEPSPHGYGLKNITTILNAHNAVYAMEYCDETRMFSFSAQLIHPGS